ncbi:hypothetical protein Q5530_07080 [Saccharothrix sp. BKS2]|uniref:hypothetical protein n=1 Tax=Saccharothrix sp. BKS2 TaxID=3064400 RepID=UPI0039E758DB
MRRPERLAEALRRADAWLLHHDHGELREPPPAAEPAVPPDWLRADPDHLRRLAGQAAAASAGTRARWAEVVAQALVIAVRHRDLDLTAALVRTATGLAAGDDPTTVAAVAFLISQQQADGGFGIVPDEGDPHLSTAVRVPLTVACASAFEAVLTATAIDARK